jgi:hypothetical protein
MYFKLLTTTKRPGEWAILGTYSSVNSANATASRLKRRETRRPDGDFQFTSRSDTGGRGLLFARSVPPEMKLD